MEPVHPHDPTPALDAAPHAPSPEALRAVREKAEAAVRGRKELSEELERRLEATLEEVVAGLRQEAGEERQQWVADLEADRAFLEQRLADWQAERAADQERLDAQSAALAAEREELDRQASALQADRQAAEQLRDQLERRGHELDERDAQLAARLAELADGGDELQQLCQQHEQELAELHKSHSAELAELRAQVEAAQQSNDSLAEELAAARDAATASGDGAGRLEQEVADLRRELADAQSALDQANADLSEALAAHAASPAGDHAAELNELHQRFELAVADAQQHRLRIDQLEQELAERPAMDNGDSAEVVRLREECDSLRDELGQLRARGDQSGGTDEEFAELQRRFEIAVEDVRDLKRQKAELEDRLLATPKSAAPASDGNDWEAQKRRLLASLEDETTTTQVTPERADEIATIEGTIKITDEVICGKDNVIADLKRQLKEAQAAASGLAAGEFTDDQRFEAERKRLAKLEEELNDKLRQTELELSIERAKVARERAQLEQKTIDLEAARVAMPPRTASVDGNGKRQSNWLKKLGLGSDEE